ncbi:MAG: Verru Chthon cassette protein [Verrucomicrobiaceae bacterium]|nr:Verru Chthon cassette protein [Verrucomicrobiaceae bacterium]
MKRFPLSGSGYPLAAFSLVETVLALGIMGLAITALLGLLPHGIEMSRKAANAAAETRIVDTLLGQLNSVPFNSLDTLDKHEFHFDDQGVAVDGTQEMAQSTYFVRLLVGSGTGGLILPGATQPEPWMRKIQIQIVQTPLLRFNFEGAPPRTFSTVPLVLAAAAP